MSTNKPGEYSLETLQRFERTLKEIEKLPERQQELIEKALKGEADLAQRRSENLTSYFSVYESRLNAISEMQRTNYKKLASDLAKLAKQQGHAPTKTGDDKKASTSSAEQKKRSSGDASAAELAKVIRDLAKVVRYGNELAASKEKGSNASSSQQKTSANLGASTGESNRAGGTTADNGYGSKGGIDVNIKPYDTIDPEKVKELAAISLLSIKDLEEERKKRIERTDNEIDEAKTKREFALRNKQIDNELRIKELKQKTIKETLDAELKAQELINSIKAEQAYAQSKKGSKELAKVSNSKDKLASEQEIVKEKADFIDEEIRKAKLANNGIVTAEEIKRIHEVADEQYKLDQKNINEHTKKRLEAEQRVAELANLKKENPELAIAYEKQKAAAFEKEKYRLQKEYGRALTAEETKGLRKQIDAEYDLRENREELLNKVDAERQKQELDAQQNEELRRRQAGDHVMKKFTSFDFGEGDSVKGRIEGIKKLRDDINSNSANADKAPTELILAIKAISSLAQQLEKTVDEIASYKGVIDTRLQGSNGSTTKKGNSYWDKLVDDMMSVGAITPYFKQETFANNIKSLVERGISFDLKQRAFLMTIQEKIANTFDVADGTLLRLIRIQQEDSTAGRLGMESALNSFLNEMYETSEYLSDVAAQVRGSLEEMEALMGGAAATEVEYQVQKWMGSLYSVGMSQNAVQDIASTLGQIASGQVDALTKGGTGNLLVMAANNAGLSIADILIEGLDAKNTNKLLQATVNYLAEIAGASKDNNLVQQQLANVFGVKASDLKAAVNLAEPGTTADIFSTSLTYSNMLKQLNNMAGSMATRTSLGEMMSNVWDNAQYSIAGSMASNPLSYLTYKLASLIDSTVGGIPIPWATVMGNGVSLETTVTDIMRLTSIGAGLLGSLDPMISGLASSFNGRAMLSSMGIKEGSGLEVTQRGGGGVGSDGSSSNSNAQSLSESGMVANGDGNVIKEKTLLDAEDSKKKQMVEAKEEEPTNQIDFINNNVLKIYELLDSVARGEQALRVKVDSYGLTNFGNSYSGGFSSGTTNQNNSTGAGTASTGTSSSSLGGWTVG